MQLDVEISEDANYKSILSKKAEVCLINLIEFIYHLKNKPPDLHGKTVDWFPFVIFQ